MRRRISRPEINQQPLIQLSNFKWKDYLIANIDLIRIGINNETLAKQHWVEHGKSQGRQLKTKEFDWTQYIAINPDLIEQGHITEEKAQEHYINNGLKEGRRTVLKDFDWEFYIIYNNHLTHTGINTQTRAIKHWIQYGRSEKLLTHINPLKECYEKIITFNYKSTHDIYLNMNNITLYESLTENDTVLQEKNLHYINNRNDPFFKQLNTLHNMNQNINHYNDFILIIDFPCYGGGCSFFLNCIISHYKYQTTFLIVRNFKGKMYWYINDEKIFEEHLNINESIKFLNDISNKIIKIFFNSIVEHDKRFIDSLFELKKETTILTHDYSLFFKKPQLYYYESQENSGHNKINIHKFSRVITQHIGNLHTFGKYMDGYNNISVSALPDFRESDREIINDGKNFVIGIIGDISDVKGYVILNELYNKIKHKNNIEIIVFGKVHIKGIQKQYSYHNINDLNVLLEKYKPNILFELSLWPESFSFTLTLAMITNLPIIYQDKFFPCTIERRLSLYNKKYSFTNMKDVDINWVINKGSNKFYLIKPIIYFPPFWDFYFTNKKDYLSCKLLNQEYNVVLITSKIYTSNKPLSYAAHRSIYSPQERLQQTVETIKSVREYIPNAYIVLYDNSVFIDNEFQTINNLVDCFLNHHNDEVINEFTNSSPHKVFGEISQTCRMLQYLHKYHTNMNIRNLFKLSGRYVLNKYFKYENLDNNDIILKRNKDVKDRYYYFTCFYKVGKEKLPIYYEVMNELYDDICNNAYEFEEWEVLFPTLLYNEFSTVDNLGVTQNISVWDDKSEI